MLHSVLKVMLLACLCLASLAGFSQRIYWTEPGNGQLMVGNLSPTGITTWAPLATGMNGPTDLAIDPAGSRVFYTTSNTEDILAIDISDGSPVSTVITTGAMVNFVDIAYSENADAVYGAMNTEIHGVYYIPASNNDSGGDVSLPLAGRDNEDYTGVAVDDGSEIVYLASYDNNTIYATDFSGTSVTDVFELPGDYRVERLAVDSRTGKIYFSVYTTISGSLTYHIMSINANGSGMHVSPSLGSSEIRSLAVYSQFNKIYFSQTSQIFMMNLNASGQAIGSATALLTSSSIDNIAIEADYTAPAPASFTPGDNGVFVPVGTTYTVNFNENIKLATATGTANETSIRIYETAGGALVHTVDRGSASISVSGSSMTISGLGALQNGTGYYVQIGSKMFTDLSGNAYAGVSTTTGWNFTTEPGVTITTASATACIGSYVTLPDIVIAEASLSNLAAGSATITLGFAGSGYTFQAGTGNVAFTGSADIAAASVTVTATTISVTYYVSGTSALDAITVSGLKFTTDNATNPSVNITRTGGSGVIGGLPAGTVLGTVSSQAAAPLPVISYTGSDNHYCQNASLAGAVVTATGTNLKWYTDYTLATQLTALAGKATVTGTELGLVSTSPGTSSRFVTRTAGGCESQPAQVDIIIDALPEPTISGGADQACHNESVTYTTEAGMSNYAWTVSAGGTITAGGTAASNSVTITWNAAGAQTVSVNYSNANGCAAVAPTVFNLTVGALPSPLLTGVAVACQGATGAVYTTSAGNTNYTWTVSAGGTITAGGTATSNTVTVTWNAAGPQTVGINYTAANGCRAASPVIQNVSVISRPVPILVGPTPVCQATTAVVYNTDAGQSNYVWNVSGGTITAGGTAVDNTVTITWPAAGARSINVNYTDASGCTAATPTVLNVQVIGQPTTAAAGNDQNVCGATATLAGNVPASGTGQWTVVTGTGGTFGNDASATSAFTGTVGNTYLLRWTITNTGCTASQDDVSITLFAPPTTAAAGNAQNICGTSTVLAGNTPTIGTGKWTIQAGAGGTIANDTDPVSAFTGIAGNTYTLRWTTSNGSCAVSQSEVSITFFAPPSPSQAGPAQSLCGTSTLLAGNTPSAGTGQWTIDSGTGGSLGSPGSPNSSFSGIAGNSYVLRWNISNGPCTPTASTVSVGFIANPTPAEAGPAQQPCGATTTLAGNTPVIGTGTWSIVTGAGGLLATPSSPTSGFSGALGISYTLRWTIDNPGCPPSTQDVNIIFIEPPTAARAGTDLSVCGATAALAANVPTSGSGSWMVVTGTGGSFGNAANPATAFNGTAGNAYVLRWTIAKNGCTSSTDEVSVKLNASPSGSGSINGLGAICPGVTGTYQVTGITDATRYTWQVPDGFELVSQAGASIDVKALPGSGGTLSVTGVNDCGSSNPATRDVTILPAPALTIHLPADAVVDDVLSFSFTSAVPVTDLNWSFGDNSTSTDESPTHAYAESGDFEVILQADDGTGCKGMDSRVLHVSPEAELTSYSIKNVVTANGDSQNGVLYIDRIERFPDSEVVVLDRWGVEVFRRTNYSNDWDFRKGEEYVPAGSYICLVKYQGKVYSRNVTVLKGK